MEPASSKLRELAIRHGEAKKRANAIVAFLSGIIPATLLSIYCPTTWTRALTGFVIGLLWGNAFEYGYHRWLLHRPRSAFSTGHREHHAQVGTIEEAEHVTLGSSPTNVATLFLINGAIAIPVDLLLKLWLTPGIFVGWSVYMLAAEEIHWRIHMNRWLPPGLRYARAYHMSHHDFPNSRYNVFLPLFDLLCGDASSHPKRIPA